jgi:hypothetical protein
MIKFNKHQDVWYNNYCIELAIKQKIIIKRKMIIYNILSLFLLLIPVAFIVLFFYFISENGISKDDTFGAGHGIGFIMFLVLSFTPFFKVKDLSDKYYRLLYFLIFDEKFNHYYYSKYYEKTN